MKTWIFPGTKEVYWEAEEAEVGEVVEAEEVEAVVVVAREDSL